MAPVWFAAGLPLAYGGRRNPDGQGFAAFGRVVRGMDVVRAIHVVGTRESR